ncbi:EamA family transporter [Streptomyces sp. GMY01]|uniref:DMT family transporter n=1 Tax=Streptomyces sp. GMY02 TaxID=1333528 RepID=UPI00146C63B8|nr:DMT family transporter [Streptomyces sp. GMY02]NMO38110.1 EamA family transporter [Streptomyces sp. GMY02]
MPSETIAIVLVAAVAHAVWNLASKYKRGDTLLFVWSYTCASAVLCVPIGLVMVTTGTRQLSWPLLLGSLVSAAFHLAYSVTLQAGYDRAELSVVYPIARGTGPVLTMLFAIVVLQEHITPVAILGALVVIAGILLVAGNPFAGRHRSPLPGMLWGAATGASIAGYTLWDSYSVTGLHLAPVSYYAGTLLLQTLMLSPGALRRRARIPTAVRANAGPILTVAVLSPLAYILVLTAMRTAPVALVAPLRESSIVIGSLLAWRLFRERNLARRLAGAGIVLAGIAAITL